MQINNWKRENFKFCEEQKYLTKFDDILNSAQIEMETVIWALEPEIKHLMEIGLYFEPHQNNKSKITFNSKLWWELKALEFKNNLKYDMKILRLDFQNLNLHH